MKVIKKGVIFKGQIGTSTQNVCFPSLARLSSGEIVVVFRVGTKKDSSDGTIMLTRSNDGGNTWTEPVKPFKSTLHGEKGSHLSGHITELSKGHLIMAVSWVDRSNPELTLFNPSTGGLLPTKMLLAHSYDNGNSWSEFKQIDTSPFTGAFLTGPILKMQSDTLLFQFETNKKYNDPSPLEPKAALKSSSNNGKTWHFYSVVAEDPKHRIFYWDQRISLLEDGRLRVSFWTHDSKHGKDINIHQSTSYDQGKIWSVPEDTGLKGQIATVIGFSRGKMVMVYVDRYFSKSIKAVMSVDDGKTWDSSTEIIIYKKEAKKSKEMDKRNLNDYLQEMELWTFGLPGAVLLDNKNIFVTFYAGNVQQTSICWSHIKI